MRIKCSAFALQPAIRFGQIALEQRAKMRLEARRMVEMGKVGDFVRDH